LERLPSQGYLSWIDPDYHLIPFQSNYHWQLHFMYCLLVTIGVVSICNQRLFTTTSQAVACLQSVCWACNLPTDLIYYRAYVPLKLFVHFFTVIEPSAFKVKPAGTVTPVKVTCAGLVPITTGAPFQHYYNTYVPFL
jgi:hypothetical protein